MQIELRDGSFDMAKLQGSRTPSWPMPRRSRRSSSCWPRSAPASRNTLLEVDRVKTQTVGVFARSGVCRARGLSRIELCRPVQQVRAGCFKFTVQANSQSRLRLEDIQNLSVRNKTGA